MAEIIDIGATGGYSQMAGQGLCDAAGISVPADGALGYAHGCIFRKLNGTGATDAVYFNVGTKDSANFDSLTDLTDSSFAADTISEFTANHGVIVDGLTIKDGALEAAEEIDININGSSIVIIDGSGASFAGAAAVKTNDIVERTAASGVTVDGVLLKDAGIVATGTLQLGGTDVATVKGIYHSGTIAVTVPSIANDAAENVDSVAVDISSLTFAAAVGDSVIPNPLAALPTDCLLLGAYVSATDEITVTFGSKEGGGGVTGAAVNFSFLIFDLT